MSPLPQIFYWLERMSPLTSREQMTLDLLTREWVFAEAPAANSGC